MRQLLLALTISIPAFAQEDEKPADAAPPPVEKPADAASYVATIESLWLKRDEPGVQQQINNAWSEGLKAFPDDYELLWRAARSRWWNSDGVTDAGLKKQLAKEGWNYAKKAVAKKPGAVEGHYFVTVNIGAYSQAVGILAALGEGLEAKFLENLNAGCKADEHFNAEGCHITRGRYHFELPWPMRDLKKSKEFLNKAITARPDVVRSYFFLAETLLADGDKAGAKAALEKAKGAAAYDPPEGRRVRAWVKDLEKKL